LEAIKLDKSRFHKYWWVMSRVYMIKNKQSKVILQEEICHSFKMKVSNEGCWRLVSTKHLLMSLPIFHC